MPYPSSSGSKPYLRTDHFNGGGSRFRGGVDEIQKCKNRAKSKVRAKAEHPIGVIKRVFGFSKVRCRGLAKNGHRLLVTAALTNLFTARANLPRSRWSG